MTKKEIERMKEIVNRPVTSFSQAMAKGAALTRLRKAGIDPLKNDRNV